MVQLEKQQKVAEKRTQEKLEADMIENIIITP